MYIHIYKLDISHCNYELFYTFLLFILHYFLHFSASVPVEPKEPSESEMSLQKYKYMFCMYVSICAAKVKTNCCFHFNRRIYWNQGFSNSYCCGGHGACSIGSFPVSELEQAEL